MQTVSWYESPIGRLRLAADEEGLIGVWIEDQKYFGRGLDPQAAEGKTPAIEEAIAWLDAYFAGQPLDRLPTIHLIGTPFQKKVWNQMAKIPYAQTGTYKQLAEAIDSAEGSGRRLARAVGHAVGINPLMILYPCHRVLGSSGSLTGYAGGLERKIWLLDHEKASR